MKKQVKKLVLAKETLRDLGASMLEKVAAGADYRLPKPDTRWEPRQPQEPAATQALSICVAF
jgi:hypothetical protein